MRAVALRARHGTRALVGMCGQERSVVVRAVVALPVTAWALRRSGLTAVHRRLLGAPRAGRRVARGPGVTRTTDLVHAVSVLGPWSTNCLQRSVVLLWLLHRQGARADLVLGVRESDSVLDFHAWVEHDGRVVNDDVAVRDRYRVLHTLRTGDGSPVALTGAVRPGGWS